MEDELPEFFKQFLLGNQIRNPDKGELHQVFAGNEIRLEEYDCYTVGYVKRKKRVVRIRILACSRRPFEKSHHIIVHPSEEILSTGFCNLKKHLGFTDKLNFLRSTFLLCHDVKKVYRLSTLRPYVTLPIINKDTRTELKPLFYSCEMDTIVYDVRDKSKCLTYVQAAMYNLLVAVPEITLAELVQPFIEKTVSISSPPVGTNLPDEHIWHPPELPPVRELSGECDPAEDGYNVSELFSWDQI